MSYIVLTSFFRPPQPAVDFTDMFDALLAFFLLVPSSSSKLLEENKLKALWLCAKYGNCVFLREKNEFYVLLLRFLGKRL